jgi:hypothetical protein
LQARAHRSEQYPRLFAGLFRTTGTTAVNQTGQLGRWHRPFTMTFRWRTPAVAGGVFFFDRAASRHASEQYLGDVCVCHWPVRVNTSTRTANFRSSRCIGDHDVNHTRHRAHRPDVNIPGCLAPHRCSVFSATGSRGRHTSTAVPTCGSGTAVTGVVWSRGG